ncbi:hypothetical protein DFH08DRAFT_799772 [Mycena albidolilacea]|uniref:Uncharacterized protein n=1 Tax=Mycena albidolilacea TaxID=1033008 RepID=A0AAD7AMD4_9AGAR|nr:hypothetical protein DFH08DRAFT_799772 [Mycena albidolilacea]
MDPLKGGIMELPDGICLENQDTQNTDQDEAGPNLYLRLSNAAQPNAMEDPQDADQYEAGPNADMEATPLHLEQSDPGILVPFTQLNPYILALLRNVPPPSVEQHDIIDGMSPSSAEHNTTDDHISCGDYIEAICKVFDAATLYATGMSVWAPPPGLVPASTPAPTPVCGPKEPKMTATNSLTACNLCTIEWINKHHSSRPAFTAYWNSIIGTAKEQHWNNASLTAKANAKANVPRCASKTLDSMNSENNDVYTIHSTSLDPAQCPIKFIEGN